MKLRSYEVAGFGFALFAAGFSAGWYLAKRDRADQPEKVFLTWDPEQQEIIKTGTHPRRTRVIDEADYVGPETRNDPKDIVWRPGGEPPPNKGTEGLEELERVDIWANRDADWDWNSELALREKLKDLGEPYVVHVDEFVDEALEDYDVFCWTYFAGDHQMVDETDNLVMAFEDHVGEGKLRFGHGSGDPNVVYIRNDELKCEYEILRDRGFYEIEVLGKTRDSRQDE